MARPRRKPANLKNGYYIEVRNRGAQSGIKIQRETKKDIKIAIQKYSKTKDVVFLGKIEEGKVIEDKL